MNAGTQVLKLASNVRTALRDIAKSLELEPKLATHSFRKSFADYIDLNANDDGSMAAKATGDTIAVVRKHYTQERTESPDLSIVEGLIGGNPSTSMKSAASRTAN